MSLEKIISLIKENKIKFEYGYIDSISTKKKVDSYILKDSLIHKPCTISVDPIGYAIVDTFKIIKENIVYMYGLDNESYYIIREDTCHLRQKLPLLNEKTLKLHELVSNWAKRPRAEIAKNIEKLDINDKFKECSVPIYRGLNLSPAALQKLASGLKVSLQKTSYSSWSEDITLAAAFVKKDGAILKYNPIDEVVININLFEKKVFNTLDYYPRLDEKEYILRNSYDILEVNPYTSYFVLDKSIVKYEKFKQKYLGD